MSWQEFIKYEQAQDYFKELQAFILEREKTETVYPPVQDRFKAFELTPFDQVRVVVIGQDPYHGEGQAHGLSFSVPKGIKIPPSLRNIYKELEREGLIQMPEHGNLESWARQGVFLLNNVLTVEAGQAGSHQKKGWEIFTDHVVEKLNREREGIVYLLWGKPAQKKGAMIDRSKNLVLESVHPSPLSAYRGFLGCNHFKLANDYLGENQTNWNSISAD